MVHSKMNSLLLTLAMCLIIGCSWAGDFTPLRVRVDRAVVGDPCTVTLEYEASAHPLFSFRATLPSEKLISAKGAPGMVVSDNFSNGHGILQLRIAEVKREQITWDSPFQILAKFFGDNYYWKITFKFRGQEEEQVLEIPDIDYNERPPKQIKFRLGKPFSLKCGFKVNGTFDYAGAVWRKFNSLQFSNATREEKRNNLNYRPDRKKDSNGVLHVVNSDNFDSPSAADQCMWQCTAAVKMYFTIGRTAQMVFLLVHIISTTDVSLEDAPPSFPVFATPIPQLTVFPDFPASPTYPRGVLDVYGPRFEKPWFLVFYCYGYGAPNLRISLFRNDTLVTRETAPNINQLSLKTSDFTDRMMYSVDCTELDKCRGQFRCVANNGAGDTQTTPTWVIKE
ncbi:uncharacterized protein LOC106179082 [Lingula anatina]|uniref:Uncharacterized protein LOC106179082 n=1 Tax=Lingula anatina TaxID=7574 RepID=A0A1S3K711_LINAN|nr:uncharacterized protein LOC106179082 [Lingula anatina]|eukprot:XP_013418046.2 uncharacterized protein LOC106179082 [Lingula anatina]